MIYDSSRWKENGWGLLRGSPRFSQEVLSNRLSYTQYWLARAARLFHLVQAPLGSPNPAPVRTFSIIGQGQETLATGVWMEQQSAPAGGLIFDADQFKTYRPNVRDDVRLNDGDGTVTVRSASLPRAYREALTVRHQQVSLSHGNLVTDEGMVETIAAFMAEAMGLPGSR